MKNRQISLCIVLPTFFFMVWGCPIGAWFGFWRAHDSALAQFARDGDDGGASEFVSGLIVGLPLGSFAGLIAGAITGMLLGILLLGMGKVIQWVIR